MDSLCSFVLVAGLLLSVIAPPALAQATGYYETPYVAVAASGWVDPAGNNTAGNDIAMFSIKETIGPVAAGKFLDFSTLSFVGQNHAAALDVNKTHSIAGQHNYTGYLGVAKTLTQPPWGNYIEFWRLFNDAAWFGLQDLGIQPVLWQIPTASGNVVQHMDVANGYGSGTVFIPRASQYITAEMVNNQLLLGAYVLHDGTGNEILPVAWSAVNLGLPVGVSCVGLTVSNGLLTTSGPGAGTRTTNIVVFVDSNLIVHSITYDVLTGVWGTLDALFGPFNLPVLLSPFPVNSIAGIRPAQNSQFTHDIGISIPDGSNPQGATGRLFVIRDLGGSYGTLVPPWGGGPLSHVPRDVAANLAGSGGTGWFVTVPGIIVNGFVVRGVNSLGNLFYYYAYPTGSTPTGIPLAHNGQAISSPNFMNGFLWVPYRSSTSTHSLNLANGSGATISTVTYTTQTNWGPPCPPQPPGWPPPPIPPCDYKPPGSLWSATTLVQGFTNNKAAYGLYLTGY